jgi:hypothetical protein
MDIFVRLLIYFNRLEVTDYRSEFNAAYLILNLSLRDNYLTRVSKYTSCLIVIVYRGIILERGI